MSDYYLLITDAGKALEAAAHASGVPVKLTDFAVGDGGGSAVTPDTAQTALVNETFRDALSSLTVSPADVSVLEAECIIPASSGGYTIREIGIFADDGSLYAVGNFAEQEKPAPESGYAASLQIFADLAVSDTIDITLTVQDGTWLTETQGNTIYLRQDKQFSEIKDLGSVAQQAARDNLGLKSAATHDITNSTSDPTAGHLLKVGDGGLLGQTLSVTDANLATINGLISMLFKQGGGSGTSHFGGYGTGIHLNYGNSGDNAKTLSGNLFIDYSGDLTVEWLEITNTDGSIARQVIRKVITTSGGTITGNSSPLVIRNATQDNALYLLARNQDNTNKWYIGNGNNGSDTASFTNYLGGNSINLNADGTILVSGKTRITSGIEVASSSSNSFRSVYGNYGVFWRNDGTNFYLMLTDSGEQYGDYNSLRPFAVNLATGAVTIGKLGLVDWTNFDARYYTHAQSDVRYARSPNDAGWGGVGTYAFLSCNAAESNGSTVAGSSLFASGVGAQKSSSGWGDKSIIQQGSTMAGTWKCCGNQPAQSGSDVGATLYYRIS
ncbi:phage tail protein [Lelliottia sp. SL45]|uniref:phage tail-collar fiber domain-containing protein n=1 Tax=Lelliottia sp. SL45 TaxID=2994665 RepID=UPI0022750DAE|nr:phage tail protein [Lelliottia sp. SL45]MCY1699473.1 phage tail protein [Lelliottia sp. SL45]